MTGKINIGGITCIYDADDISKEIIITGYEGADSRVMIPDYIMPDNKDYIVTKIGKKAFLGAKFLKEISLPGTVKSLEDWAFASCTHLEKLTIRAMTNAENVEDTTDSNTDNANSSKPSDKKYADLIFGKGVFDSCEALESILLGYEEADDFSVLLGAAIWRLPAPYLFMDPDIGKESWFHNWDKALENYLNSKDDDGYTDRVLCGEEDISYDGIGSVDGELLSDGTNFVIETRKRKCLLCLLRLMANKNLSEAHKKVFEEYIKARGKKSKISKESKQEEAWLVLRNELKGRIEYLKFYASIGGIDVDLIDDMLTDLGEDYAEGKAYLIRYKRENTSGNNFFSNLLL